MTSVFASICIGVIAPSVLEIPIQRARNTVTPMSVATGRTRSRPCHPLHRQVLIGLTRDGPVRGIDQDPFLERVLMLAHRTEVESEICDGKHEQDR